MSRFSGKAVLVTGAASGIGLATAVEFARESARLVATNIDREGLNRALDESLGTDAGVETAWQHVTD